MHQPMHATMIMLVDLYERPSSIEASRSRAFIDAVFAISGPDGGIVSGEDGVTVQRPLREGGREAWDLLRKLREKAWRKAGLDPSVLWTEETQIQAGVALPLTEEQRMAQALREDLLNEPVKVGEMDERRPQMSATAGVQNLVSSAVADMQNAMATATTTKPAAQKPPTLTNLNNTHQYRATTSFPPHASQSSYSTAPPRPTLAPAPSIAASPNASLTRTTTTSQEQENNTATVDSLRLDVHGGTPAPAPPMNDFQNGSAAAPSHEEHHDADFWTRWDSVLGAHPEFTFEDAMEGIVWDDLGESG